jgi:hypothetical protein
VQDEGSISGRIDFTFGQENPGVPPWRRAPGGEGTQHAIDPTDPATVYASTFYGRLTRAQVRERGAARTTSIAPPRGEGEDEHRGEWLAATTLSPHNPKTLYHGMQYVFRSDDRGETWRRISPDLTHNDPKKAGILPYAISYQTITALDESPLKAGVLYAGTDDGRVHVTRDGGANWSEITRGLPKGAHVSRLVASKWAENVVYAALSDRREDSIAPYVYRSDDYGKTWRSLAANLPPHPVNVVREDPKAAQILYVGTDMGLYQSLDSGKSWRSLSHGLPAAVSVQDLIVHPRDDKLVIATYGRGFYALDDMTALRMQ